MEVIGGDGTVAKKAPSLVMEAGDIEDKNEKPNDQDMSNSVNLMDFSDTTLGFSQCAKMQFSRPVLNTVREQFYESKAHTSQAMQEMYRLLNFELKIITINLRTMPAAYLYCIIVCKYTILIGN